MDAKPCSECRAADGLSNSSHDIIASEYGGKEVVKDFRCMLVREKVAGGAC